MSTPMSKTLAVSLLLYLLGYFYGITIAEEELTKHPIQNFNENIDLTIEYNFIDILINNIKVIIINLLGGFLLGSIVVTNTFLNGVNLGTFLKLFVDGNITPLHAILLIFPHGIFEIPAIIIAGAAGFKIPYEIVRYLAGRKEQILTKEDFKEYLTLALISIVLIVIAAWIEANVTLKIAKAMLNSSKGI